MQERNMNEVLKCGYLQEQTGAPLKPSIDTSSAGPKESLAWSGIVRGYASVKYIGPKQRGVAVIESTDESW